jgi:hypothetical protein
MTMIFTKNQVLKLNIDKVTVIRVFFLISPFWRTPPVNLVYLLQYFGVRHSRVTGHVNGMC